MDAQIAAAVQAAVSYNPSNPGLQAEAYKFLSEVKDSCTTTWQTCLQIFLDGSSTGDTGAAWMYTHSPEARMFGLQVVDDVLSASFEILSQEQVAAMQAGMVDYVKREYTAGNAEGNHIYLRNKVAHTLFLLFMQTYITSWPDFFQTFFAILPTTNSSTEPFNPKATDLFLRLLHDISTEISDTTLRLNKGHKRLTRDTELRDAVRARDAANVIDHTIRILSHAVQRIGQPSTQLSTAQAVELAEMSMRVLADYASWIDSALIITPVCLQLLFQCLTLQQVKVRLQSAELLYELVAKGMPPADKLELIRVLNVAEIIRQLLEAEDNLSKAQGNGHGIDDEQEELFKEKLARVLNILGMELTKIVDETSATEEQKATALSSALALRPLILRFLGDDYDDTSATVIPFLQSIMSIYKKDKKRNAQGHLTDDKAQYLRELLLTVFRKMRYSREEEWPGDDDEEDGANEDVEAFIEFRKNMKTVYDAVAWIDFDLLSEGCKNFVFSTLDAVDAGGAGQSWEDVELALYILYLYGEPAAKATAATGVLQFLKIPREELAKQKKQPDYRIDSQAYPPSVLGEIMLRAIDSKAASWPHAAVPMQFFECISRYHDFFQLAPAKIMTVMPVFLDGRGLHQSTQAVRSRCFYLFNRFVFTAREQLQQHLPPDAIGSICSQVEDLLPIKADVAKPESPGEDVLSKAAGRGSAFDHQLYLFEALGALISLLGTQPQQQVNLLQALLQPLIASTSAAASSQLQDASALLKLHHAIKAIGNVAYGFPEIKNHATTPAGAWVAVVISAMESALQALKTNNKIAVIREATLAAFKNVAARTGGAALPLVAPLIENLIDELSASELVDFLPFIGMLCHRYKDAFREMLDLLLASVCDRTYFFLEQPVTGTDDIQQHSELRRAYFTLLMSICTALMSDVFYSSRNSARLETLLGSIPHYIGNGSLLPDQKGGLAVVNRLVTEWVKPIAGDQTSPLPPFKDFVYQRILNLCLELPVRQAFDYSDVQAYNVIGEVATLYKTLLILRQQEFIDYLTTTIFPAFAMPQQTSNEFLRNLTQASDSRTFKKWLAPFLQKAKQSSNDKPYSVAHLLTAVPSAGQS